MYKLHNHLSDSVLKQSLQHDDEDVREVGEASLSLHQSLHEQVYRETGHKEGLISIKTQHRRGSTHSNPPGGVGIHNNLTGVGWYPQQPTRRGLASLATQQEGVGIHNNPTGGGWYP